MALFEGIVPAELRPKALEIMAENARASEWILQKPSANYPSSNATTGGPGAHMTAGLFGIKWFLMSLADGGLNDLAYEVLTTPTYPGYKWMMNNAIDNATTIWESWSFSDSTFSHNHPSESPAACHRPPARCLLTATFMLMAVSVQCLPPPRSGSSSQSAVSSPPPTPRAFLTSSSNPRPRLSWSPQRRLTTL
jgi:hypothetical protein